VTTQTVDLVSTQSLDREATVENGVKESNSRANSKVRHHGNVSVANHLAPQRERLSAMARRRFQNPKPFKEGN
jgi:hypothetical protein